MPATCNTRDRKAERTEIETEVDRLGKLIKDHFPAEAAGAEFSDRKDIVRLATVLLERLWRWER